MNPALIILILVVAPVVLGAGLKWVKAMMEEQEQKNRRNRQRTGAPVAAPAPPPSTRGGSSDIDRFLQEIDKLRKRDGDPAPAPKPAVAKPAVAKAKPKAKPVAKDAASEPAFASNPAYVTKVDKAAAANEKKVFAPPPTVTFTAPPSPILNANLGVKQKAAGKTEFSKNLMAILSNKQSVPMAVVLTEILGPPKCKESRT